MEYGDCTFNVDELESDEWSETGTDTGESDTLTVFLQDSPDTGENLIVPFWRAPAISYACQDDDDAPTYKLHQDTGESVGYPLAQNDGQTYRLKWEDVPKYRRKFVSLMRAGSR